jgi:hypothetical protein
MQEHYLLYCIARYKNFAVDLNFYTQGVTLRKERIISGVFDACKYHCMTYGAF